jgi:hypothetical protein
MPQRHPRIDDDAVPVLVPRNEKVLVPLSPERIRNLRRHLVSVSRAAKDPDGASHARPEPHGFAARVVRAACSLCRGQCCGNGGDDAFLDESTIARLALDACSVLRLYIGRVPVEGYAGSCILHGKQGCTLDRSMRSDVCNAYFCGGFLTFLAGGETATPTVVIAGDGNKMRTSPVLIPRRIDSVGIGEKDT